MPCAKNRMAMKERLSIDMGVTIFWFEKRRNWLTLWDCIDGTLVPCTKNRMAMKERLTIEMGITIFWLEKTSKLSHNRGLHRRKTWCLVPKLGW